MKVTTYGPVTYSYLKGESDASPPSTSPSISSDESEDSESSNAKSTNKNRKTKRRTSSKKKSQKSKQKKTTKNGYLLKPPEDKKPKQKDPPQTNTNANKQGSATSARPMETVVTVTASGLEESTAAETFEVLADGRTKRTIVVAWRRTTTEVESLENREM